MKRDLKDFAALLAFAAFANVFRPHGELFATLGTGRPMGRGGACHIDGLQGDWRLIRGGFARMTGR
jgi:hypothetical protein